MLQMRIISEKDMHEHDVNVSIVPTPAALVSVKPKAYNNDSTSVINSVVVGSASLNMPITASGGDGVSGAVEDAAGYVASSSSLDADGVWADVDAKTTKAAAAAANNSKAKSPMIAQIIKVNVQSLRLQ